MNIEEIYKRFAADNLGVKYDDVESVGFSHFIGEGSSDMDSDDFSTFAGSEMWYASVMMKGDTYASKSINFWGNPVSQIMGWVREHNVDLEFDPPTPPSDEELMEAHLRRY